MKLSRYKWIEHSAYDVVCGDLFKRYGACENPVKKGNRILYDTKTRIVYCESCGEDIMKEELNNESKNT